MGLQCGIVGLPNVGKSTLFNALTSSQNAQALNYPFCTIEPNLGTVVVPDLRLDELNKIYKSKKVVPSTIDFVDIAGLVKGASKGEGLGNQFLSHIREVDAIIHIVRCFDNDNIIHINGNIDPARDIETVETELIFKDLEIIKKRYEKVSKLIKIGDKKSKKELELLDELKNHLVSGKLAKYFFDELHHEDIIHLSDLNILTNKPVLYVANVSDTEISGNKYSEIVRHVSEKENAKFLALAVEIESEIANLQSNDEKKEFLESLELNQSGLDRLIFESYSLLGLITFFTASDKELHSRTIQKGIKAIEAAGKIHTDFERGFIRAEIIKYKDLIALGSEHSVREKGLLYIEGRDYEIQDADIVFYRFNV
ncbi:MAG: redox-regulated ATPase YchF [Ignavibacteria bacterium]|nr:redox-regulated ATPase YchF [Ignavibacteria bacterium]